MFFWGGGYLSSNNLPKLLKAPKAPKLKQAKPMVIPCLKIPELENNNKYKKKILYTNIC